MKFEDEGTKKAGRTSQESHAMRGEYFKLAKEGADLLNKRADLNLEVDRVSQRLSALYEELDRIGATAGMSPDPF